MTDETTILGWHFAERGVLAHGDDRTLRVGETYRVEPPIQCCARGLHASERVLDAWSNVAGRLLCRVALSGALARKPDKIAAAERRVLDIRRVTPADIARLRAAVAAAEQAYAAAVEPAWQAYAAAVAPAEQAYDAAVAAARQAYAAAVAAAEQAYAAAVAAVELAWYAALPAWQEGGDQ